MNSSNPTPVNITDGSQNEDRMFTDGNNDYYRTTKKDHMISPKVQSLLMRKNSIQVNSAKTISLKGKTANAQKVVVSKSPSVSNFKARDVSKEKKKVNQIN